MGRPNQNPVFDAQTVQQPNGVPMTGAFNNQSSSNWNSGLFDCMNDGENAIITCCFPCITFGQIAEVIDESPAGCMGSGMLYTLLSFLWIPCVYSCTYRTKLRNKYGLPDEPAPDCITHAFCDLCALCQEYRELKIRGLDPAIGWSGNVQKQRMGQEQEMMAPPMSNRMMG